MPVKKEAAQALTGQWSIGLFEAPCKNPGCFCAGYCCLCCAAYKQREELLQITGEPYVCCAGMFPCGPLGKPQDQNCLICESFCCPSLAVAANRFMVQTRFDKQNTPCDDYIIIFTCIFSWAVFIGRCILGDMIPEELENIADCLVMIVNGCMHAQQDYEIKEIQKSGYQGPPQAVLNSLPPQQAEVLGMGKAGGKGPMQQEMS